jgi:hypothetical protein
MDPRVLLDWAEEDVKIYQISRRQVPGLRHRVAIHQTS